MQALSILTATLAVGFIINKQDNLALFCFGLTLTLLGVNATLSS